MEAKLPWMEYSDAMAEFRNIKEERATAEQCLEARKREYEESQQPLR